jgi:HEAT repeat protein
MTVAGFGLVGVAIGIYNIATKRARVKRHVYLILYRWEVVTGQAAVRQGWMTIAGGLFVMFLVAVIPIPLAPGNRSGGPQAPNVAEGGQPPPRAILPGNAETPHAVPPALRPLISASPNTISDGQNTLTSMRKQIAEDQKKRDEEQEARRREAMGPNPSDPAYLDKLADRVLSENILDSEQAIDVLLNTDPATSSPETKKKVARAFRSLAMDDQRFFHDKAIRGLAKWAGNYSVPVLLEILEHGLSPDRENAIKALAELKDTRAVPVFLKLLDDRRFIGNERLLLATLTGMKDPRAAPALAARITDHQYGRLAWEGVRGMGSDAEDALTAVADSGNAEILLTALTLLGDVGTEKSLNLMHRAQESRNRTVRLTAMAAAAKINKRRLEAKSKSKSD